MRSCVFLPTFSQRRQFKNLGKITRILPTDIPPRDVMCLNQTRASNSIWRILTHSSTLQWIMHTRTERDIQGMEEIPIPKGFSSLLRVTVYDIFPPLFDLSLKVAQSSFLYFLRRRFWWFLFTTLYHLMLQLNFRKYKVALNSMYRIF